MTGREALERSYRPMRRVMLGGLGVIVLSIGLLLALLPLATRKGGPADSRFLAPGVVGIIAGALILPSAGAFANSVRCPWCDGLMLRFAQPYRPFREIMCCPLCGKSLDEELPASINPGKPRAKGTKAKKPKPWDDELA